MKAVWNGHVVADSDETVVVEGNTISHRVLLMRVYCEKAIRTARVLGKVKRATMTWSLETT